MNSALKILTVLFFLFRMTIMKSQIVPATDQYILNPVLINPANTGSRGAMSIAAFYRRQWAGIKGAPETIRLVGDSPFSDGKVGLGFMIMHDKVGITSETSISGSYSYKIDTWGGNLAFGLKAGFQSTNTRFSELTVLDPGDELYLTDSRNYIAPDIGFGLYWANTRYYGGFSIPRLIGYKFNLEKDKYAMKINPGDYNYLLNAGMTTNLSADVDFMPSMLVSVVPGQKTLLDINAYFGFGDKVWAGTSFRSNKSAAGMFQFAVNNQFRIAYSYDIDFSRLGRFSNGSHEIMLRYDFQYKADIVNPLIF